MTETIVQKTNEWAFPTMESNEQETNFIETTTIASEKKESMSISEVQQQQVVNSAQAEQLERLKSEYERKLALLNNVISQVDNSFSNLDDEISVIISNMIKGAIKKIILKEINLEPAIINNMIEELKTITKTNTSLCSIFVSSTDYQLLGLDKASATVKVDNSLSSGDVVIRSNSSEIKAILDERIEKLLGINNE